MTAEMYFRTDIKASETKAFSEISVKKSYKTPDGQLAFITDCMTLEAAEELKEKIEAEGKKVFSVIPVLG